MREMATTSLSLFQHYPDAEEEASLSYNSKAEENGQEMRDAMIFEEKEVRAYAKYLGIKDHEYQDLRGLAIEGLTSDLPSDWQTCTTPDKGKRKFYHNTKSKRSQWEHPQDKVYKEKVEAARKEASSRQLGKTKKSQSQSRSQSRSHSPAVLGDVTNSKIHRNSSNSSKKKKDRSSSKKKKLLPPLRLAPIDVPEAAVAATNLPVSSDLNEQNPLYKELSVNHYADSDSATSTISSSRTERSLTTRSKGEQKTTTSKQRKSKATGNKRSPREMRIRERSKDQSRSSNTAMDSDSNSSSLSRSSKSWEGSNGGAHVDGHEMSSSHSPSSSPGSSSALSPREPGDRLKKKKGSPRRIEKLNGLHGQVKLSPLARAAKNNDDNGRNSTVGDTKTAAPSVAMSKSKSKLLKHQELAEHHMEICEVTDPVQLSIKIDIDEDESVTKEDIQSLRTLQQDTILELKQEVVARMEDTFEKCVTKMGNELKESQKDLISGFMKVPLGRDSATTRQDGNQATAIDKADSKQMECIKEEEASLLKQLKGEIDLISDYYDRDESAKKERDALLVAKNKDLKISLEQECNSKLKLQESLEKATQQAEKDRAEMNSRIESQKTEIENLISRVSEASKDKFQMAENFNKSVVEQRDEMVRLLKRVWDKVKKGDKEKEPSNTGIDHKQMEGLIQREFASLSSALADQLAEKQKDVVQYPTQENEKNASAMEEIANSILSLIKENHEVFLENFKSVTHDERVAKKYSKKVTKEIKEQIECIENKFAGKDLAQSLERIEATQNEYRKSSSQAFAQALEQYELCIGKVQNIKGTLTDDLATLLEEKMQNHFDKCNKNIHGMFEAVSSKIDDFATSKEDQFLTKEDFKSKLEETTNKLTEALEKSAESQRLLLETTLKEKDRQKQTLISEACQTEQFVDKVKAKKKLKERADDVKVKSFSTPKGSTPSESPLKECSSHSKKQIVLLRQSVETAKAKQSTIKRATRKLKGNDRLLHNFETYVNGLQCSSESTRDIHKYLKGKGVW